MVVDQSLQTITLHLAKQDGVSYSDSTSFMGADAGYFDQNGYLYYGGIQTTDTDVSIDGKMIDIRFWDTYAISS